MPNSSLQMRLMGKADFPAFDLIQTAAYKPLFLESLIVFQRRIDIFPEGNFMVEDANRPVAYLVCHPWRLNEIVLQDDVDIRLPATPDCFYIHSATIIPSYQTRGLGRELFEKAKRLADQLGFEKMALVSVQNSHLFWSKCGFRAVPTPAPRLASKLASYGLGARYMIRG